MGDYRTKPATLLATGERGTVRVRGGGAGEPYVFYPREGDSVVVGPKDVEVGERPTVASGEAGEDSGRGDWGRNSGSDGV